jgi:branched-chain amino acid aminotransferase
LWALRKLYRFVEYGSDVKFDKLEINKAPKFKEKIPLEKLLFGKEFTDHMLEIDWEVNSGWKTPQIRPYGKLELDPAAMVFHYAIEVFFINDQLPQVL